MLTIGELARFLGVTTRTIRFYHQRGLIAEPVRDESGYRRYDADDVVQLRRIVTLAAAGVPLAEIGDLLDSDDAAFRAAIARVDDTVAAEIARLTDLRERLSVLASPDRVALPAYAARMIAELRQIDVNQAYVDQWRDSWVLAHALYPAQMAAWDAGMLDDADYRAMQQRTFELADADPADPRIDALAAESLAWLVERPAVVDSAWEELFTDPRANALMDGHWLNTPAWERLSELVLKGLEDHGFGKPPSQRSAGSPGS